MDLRKVKKLIELVEESGIAELEVSSGDESIRIALGTPRTVSKIDAQPNVSAMSQVTAEPAQRETAATQTVISPMAGVFYEAPNPDAKAFVELGQQVLAGEVLCIIESMKMMNEITVVNAGTVTEICAVNGEPVATGSVLFKLS
jgi:acetyl-CoA carboxylase biotin carboxyl carrier protein